MGEYSFYDDRPIDLCALYEPIVEPPEEVRPFPSDDLPEPDCPFYDTVERQVSGMCFVVHTECGGTELLGHKVTSDFVRHGGKNR